jgi:peptidoglycan-associated lipoprotein
MFQQRCRRLFIWNFLVLVGLTGCGPGSSRVQKYSGPDWSVENPLAAKGASEGSSQNAQMASRNMPRGAVSSSSLEALRKGESTATPESSPLKDIQFDFDRYDLRADARDTLKTTADWLKRHMSTRVEIEGHCDERGTNEYNLALGAKRSQAAKDYLVTLGIQADRISMISYGEEIPVCKEHNEACWAKNRRDRFVLVPGRTAP